MSARPATQPISSIVVVGAGIAGVRTALTLRESGYEGGIQLVSDEPHAPYDRPPLSKSVLIEPDGHDRIRLDPDRQLELGGVELIAGDRCVAIDRGANAIALASGRTLPYDRLVLATGSKVREIEALPASMQGVHYLRTLDDALALKQATSSACEVAVVGAGVIGLEVAASLRGQGHRVTVLDPASRVMMRSASPPLAEFLERRHRAEGVDLRLGVVAETVARVGNKFTLTLSDGHLLSADVVVVGVGVMPNDELGRAGGLETGPSGIVVDAQGRTSDPAIYATGEVAFHFNDHLGRHDRQETWAHAAAHGEHVARAILGADDGYRERSSYWTDQYDINVQVVGEPIGEKDVLRGDLAHGSGLIFHVARNVIAGVTAINAVRDLRTARKLIGARIEDSARLADVTIDLKSMV